MIKIDNITFSYNKKIKVFEDYSLDIGEDLTFLTGINGAGKSTLIRLIMGILKPEKGAVYMDGRDIKKMKLSQLGKHNGYLFQNPDNMLFANTVYEELSFPMLLNGEKEDVVRRKVEDALSLFGLQGREEDFPLTLSIGQRQRLALATIFMREPDRLLLDEPTSRLDYKMKGEFINLIKELLSMGKGIIIATHDEELIRNLTGEIVELRR